MKFLVLCILFSVFLFAFSQISLAEEALEGFTFHKVKIGDTLSKIAPLEHWDIIRRVNRIDEAHLIIGKTILIPTDLEKANKFLPVPEYMEGAEKTERTVYIFLEKQYFGAYENGQLAFWGPISSGKKERETPRGNFKVLWKTEFYHSKKYDANMPFAVNISNNGYFLHEQSLPGRPASHGCIRLLREDAKKLFNWVKKHDPVILTKTAPDNIGAVFLFPNLC